MVSPISLLKLCMRRMAGEFWLDEGSCGLVPTGCECTDYRFFSGLRCTSTCLFSIMGRVNNRESLYSVVTTVLLANISYVPFVRLPVFWKSSFQEWFPVSVLCCVQKHGAVRSGNRKRCRRRHKTDRIVLGNGTQDSRCRYFCIIAGQTGFSLRFLFEEDGG